MTAFIALLLLVAFSAVGYALWSRLSSAKQRKQENSNTVEAPLISLAWVLTLVSLGGVGTLSIVLYATQFVRTDGVAVASVGLAASAAAMMAGALLGFLFGIPRSLQEQREAEGGAGREAAAAQITDPGYRANTNLEQISDWLTKILVGVGLTQLGEVGAAVGSLAAALKPALGGLPSSGTFGVLISLYFVVCGFLYGYVWARVNVARAFRSADLAALGRQLVQQVESKIERQSELDARALTVVTRQLDPVPGVTPVSEQEIIEAVKRASAPVKVQIFQQARAARSATWRANRAKVESTVPIFRALVESAPGRFHRNHAQLGFALKDQPNPDWEAAEKELSKAIRLRGHPETSGHPLYEFNRAICRIHLDTQVAAGQPSSAEVKAQILEDLKVTRRHPETLDLLQEDPVAGWMVLNSVLPTDLD